MWICEFALTCMWMPYHANYYEGCLVSFYSRLTTRSNYACTSLLKPSPSSKISRMSSLTTFWVFHISKRSTTLSTSSPWGRCSTCPLLRVRHCIYHIWFVCRAHEHSVCFTLVICTFSLNVCIGGMTRISLLLHEPVVRIVRDVLGSGFPPRICNCDTASHAVMFTSSCSPCCRLLVWASPLELQPEQS